MAFLIDTSVAIHLRDGDPTIAGTLAAEYGDGAHSGYNALVRRLVSFQRAAACAM